MATTSSTPAANAASTSNHVLRLLSTRSSRLSMDSSLSRKSEAARKRCIASCEGSRSFCTNGRLIDDSSGFCWPVVGFSRSLAMISSCDMPLARSCATARNVSTSWPVNARCVPDGGLLTSDKNSRYTFAQWRSVEPGIPTCWAARAGVNVCFAGMLPSALDWWHCHGRQRKLQNLVSCRQLKSVLS